jgi:altronate dehydratase small subunit
MKRDAIVIKKEDNVATALRDLSRNDLVRVGVGEKTIEVLLVESVEYGHKFAMCDIMTGQEIVKYGEVIGRATADILAGAHAHIQNIESLRGRGDLTEGVGR